MRLGLFLIIGVAIFSGCSYEDERSSDFAVDHSISEGFFSGKKLDGTITNISSTPAHSITLKVDIDFYEGSCDYDYITINETLYQNDQADFCLSLADSAISVTVTINEVK